MTDYIKRADALNLNCVITVRRADTKERKCDDEIIKACFEAYVEHIKKLPSADAVYGKWLPIEETIPTYDGGEKTWITGMKCSNCGKLLDLRVGYYYCPTCGARMKGGNE